MSCRSRLVHGHYFPFSSHNDRTSAKTLRYGQAFIWKQNSKSGDFPIDYKKKSSCRCFCSLVRCLEILEAWDLTLEILLQGKQDLQKVSLLQSTKGEVCDAGRLSALPWWSLEPFTATPSTQLPSRPPAPWCSYHFVCKSPPVGIFYPRSAVKSFILSALSELWTCLHRSLSTRQFLSFQRIHRSICPSVCSFVRLSAHEYTTVKKQHYFFKPALFCFAAVASEIQSTFYSVSSSDLVSSWVGESEKQVSL